MKTAMQFLKEEIESKIIPSSKENGELTDYQYGHNIAYSVVLTLAEYLIKKEKEQIIDAYISDRIPCSEQDGEDYYFSTYKIEKITITEHKQNK
jgi:hypothetical protein